jgi:hypothetical protein
MGYSAYPPAASGPTLAEIQTAVSTYSTPYNGTWTDLGTTSISGSSSVTITGLGGYKQLKIFVYLEPSTASYVTMRLNGDTGSNYGYVNSNSTTSAQSYPTTGMRLGPSSGASVIGYLTISPANSTTSKKTIFSDSNFSHANTSANFTGVWLSTAAITSATFVLNTGTFSGGGIQIWGIN